MNLIYGLLLIATLCVSAVSTARADDAPLIVETVRQAAVYGEPSRSERPVARIYFGAVLSVRPAGQKNGCRPGWLRIEGGGYICRSAVKESKRALGPAPDDRPDIDSGLERWKVEKGGAVSYASELDFQHRRKDVFLFRGTIVNVRRVVERAGSRWLITREGRWVQGDHARQMTPETQLGVSLTDGAPNGIGFVIDGDTPVRDAPEPDATVLRSLTKFSVLRDFSVQKEWLKLADGGFVADRQVARFRVHQPAEAPLAAERWISVDLEEQVLAAWEGNRPVRVVPCSTGSEGNTGTGSYRIRWKRRLQTMELYNDHLRVEDVQWVMYYIPNRGFAIHSAWHNDFGYPVSHGCVNLPGDDARWLYEWSAPAVADFHSETFDTPFEKGSRVIVF